MSYNPAYGQPQAQMQMQLPVPFDRPITSVVQNSPGQPPVLPTISYVPPPLQQFYPYLVSCAIDAVQSKYNSNPLRMFLFNMLAQNGFNNPQFTAFVEGLAQRVEVKVQSGQFNDQYTRQPNIQVACEQCAVLHAEQAAARNVADFPALAGQLDQGTMMAVRQVQQNLANDLMEIQRYFQQVQMQQQMQQVPMGTGQAFLAGGFQPQGVPMQHFQQQNDMRASTMSTQPSGSFGWGPAAGTQLPQTTQAAPVQDRFERMAQLRRPALAPAVQPQSPHTQNVHAAAHLPPSNLTPPPPPPAPAAATVQMLPADVKWAPSEEFPVTPVYDPNGYVVFYQPADKGKMRPTVQPKPQSEVMDINKHLSTPSIAKIAPVAVTEKLVDTNVRVMETESSIADDILASANLDAIPDIGMLYGKGMRTDISFEDMWLYNEVRLGVEKKGNKRANMFRNQYCPLSPLVTQADPKPMINAIAQTKTFQEACRVMNEYLARIKAGDTEHGDEKALTFINARLSQRLNNFLKKNLAVPLGWVESFMEDAPAVPGFLEKKYGQKHAVKVVEAQVDIITSALSYLKQEWEDQQNSNLLNEADKVTMEALGTNGVHVTYFFMYATLTSTDLYSSELKFEFSQKEVANAIFQQQNPLLHKIAEDIFTYERAVAVQFDRHLLRTADGVTLEFMTSPINQQIYLLCSADL